MDSAQFRKLGYEMIDWVAQYLEHGYSGPVYPGVEPGEILNQLPSSPPIKGEGGEALFADFKSIILPGLTHWNDRRFFGYFPCNNSAPSVLAELLVAGLGVNAFSWITSPAATELEVLVMRWLGEMIGLPWPGVIQDTASTASLCALLSARERAYPVNQKGFATAPIFKVYASDQAHSSILKGARIAGLGDENVQNIPSDSSFAMDVTALRAVMKADVAAGAKPLIVVASVGTTSSTAVDPVEAIAAVCREYGAWLHIDAALAGTAAIVPEQRSWIMQGVDLADSFVFNPHKWMFTNFDCSAYFCKDPDQLKHALAISPEYLKGAHDGVAENFRDWGIQLGRRFRALKLWFVIRSFGVEGLRDKIRLPLQMAQDFARLVTCESRMILVVEPRLNTVCFKLKSDAETEALHKAVNASGNAFLTHTRLGGSYVIRVSFGQTNAQREDVENLWSLIRSHLCSR